MLMASDGMQEAGPNGEPTVVRRSFRKASEWGPVWALSFGDKHAGPAMVFAALGPMNEPPALSPAHSHPTDTWRMSLRGEMPVGRERYKDGEFRFQQGGRAYGQDSVSWGSEGGWSAVTFGDRRGLLPITVRKEDQDVYHEDSLAQRLLRDVGCSVDEHLPPQEGVSTTIGSPLKGGRVDGSFQNTQNWSQLSSGVRLAAGLFGDHNCGPVVLLFTADSSQQILPAATFETEAIHLIVRGSCLAGQDVLEAGDYQISAAGARCPELVAGESGADVVLVLGDRRHALPQTQSKTESDGWSKAIRAMLDELSSPFLISQ